MMSVVYCADAFAPPPENTLIVSEGERNEMNSAAFSRGARLPLLQGLGAARRTGQSGLC